MRPHPQANTVPRPRPDARGWRSSRAPHARCPVLIGAGHLNRPRRRRGQTRQVAAAGCDVRRPDGRLQARLPTGRQGRGVVLNATATRPLSPVPTTGRTRGADERTATAVTAAATRRGSQRPSLRQLERPCPGRSIAAAQAVEGEANLISRLGAAARLVHEDGVGRTCAPHDGTVMAAGREVNPAPSGRGRAAVGYLGRLVEIPNSLSSSANCCGTAPPWSCPKRRRLAQRFDTPPGYEVLSAPAGEGKGVRCSVNAALGTHPQRGRPDRARSSSGPGQRDAGW